MTNSSKKGDDIVVCPECGAPHHRECYEKEGHCHFADKHGADFSFEKEQLEEAEQQAEQDAKDGVVLASAAERKIQKKCSMLQLRRTALR